MRVTLVYRGRYHIRQALELETLVPLLRLHGHNVKFVYDPDTFGVTDNVIQAPWLARIFSSREQIATNITKNDPEVVIFSVLPSTYKWSKQVAIIVKEHIPAPIVFFGLFPSLVPERVMQDAFVDYVIRGEAENIITSLLEAISDNKKPSETGNLWYRQGDKVQYTYQAPFVNLDTLPVPDKELFYPYVSHSYSYTTFVSRGCSYNCTYCEETCMKRIFGPKYFRRKSVDTVIKELTIAKKRYGFREVIFKDSYLSGNKKWLTELMRQYCEDICVPFKCFCTTHGFDEETAKLLKGGGCYCVEFGLQTWNENIRQDILRRKENNKDVCYALECCAKHKLWYDVDHMFNLPYETRQDHIDGAFCYHKLRYLNRVKVHHLLYYPTAEIVSHGIASKKLTIDAQENLVDGYESDFYDQQDNNNEDRILVSAYGTLYKILPIMPDSLLHWFTKRNHIKLLRRIPSPILAILQTLVAVRGKDLRFKAYLCFYPRKVVASFKRSLGQYLLNLFSIKNRTIKKVTTDENY